MTEYNLSFREEVQAADREKVREIVESSGFFSPEEIDIAVELVDEGLTQGEKSGYFFLFAELEGCLIGYTCFGPIGGTLYSYDLYWIAVREPFRHVGIGKDLLARSEALIFSHGGRRIYVETSARAQYERTLNFYLACGYRRVALLNDFYSPGDGKIILEKVIQSEIYRNI